jgi:hypothetical protein
MSRAIVRQVSGFQFLVESRGEQKMAALKKSSILLAVAILALMSIGTASAQGPVAQTLGTISCVATATPVTVRAEGIAELVGDIVLTCTNLSPAAGGTYRNYLTTNISVSLAAVNVTNNIDFGAGANVLDTVLIVNGNNTIDTGNGTFVAGTDPTATPTFPAIGTGLDERFQRPQFGVLAANNRVEWNAVQFPVPGAPNATGAGSAVAAGFCGTAADFDADDFTNNPAGCFPSTTNIRITSLRANASMLGVPGQATFPSTQVTAFVSITGETLPPITNNVLNVAVPLLGLLTDVDGAVAGLQCVDEDGVDVDVILEEGFATAFKTLGVATSAVGDTQDESGYFAPGSNNGGGARQATRFIARFFNIPSGVVITVPEQVENLTAPNQLILRLVEGTDANGAGGALSGGSGTQDVSLSGGFGVAVYEVLSANPSALESIDFTVTISWEADTANDLPAIGSGQISVSFAPVSTVLTASSGDPEPRFIDTNPDPQTIVTISRCTTTILFPFVTNQSGFDTGLVISNTSDDWGLMNTEPQDGTCTIHHIGSTTGGGAAPPDATSTVIAAGEQLLWTLSGGNPAQGIGEAAEFQGYIIAVCEFQYGHGFAFITNGFGGIPTIAQGYLALIIPFDGASRHAGDWHYSDDLDGFVADGFGERLNQ